MIKYFKRRGLVAAQKSGCERKVAESAATKWSPGDKIPGREGEGIKFLAGKAWG